MLRSSKFGKASVALLFISLFAALCHSAHASRPKTFRFEATMLAKLEAPKVSGQGSGSATITIVGTRVCWRISGLEGIDTPIAAHIHKGKAGVPGPVVIPLDAKFKLTGCIFPTLSTVKALEANPKGYYVNVHTKRYPSGAIRGQLRSA